MQLNVRGLLRQVLPRSKSNILLKWKELTAERFLIIHSPHVSLAEVHVCECVCSVGGVNGVRSRLVEQKKRTGFTAEQDQILLPLICITQQDCRVFVF